MAGVEAESGPHAGAGDEGSSLVGRLLLCELAITASFFAAPAQAQSVQRVDLVGRVEARCSAVTPTGLSDIGVIRALTVRCSGPSPALSIRARSQDDPEVTLTVASAAGLTEGERLSTREGNVLVDLADLQAIPAAGRSRAPVEIVVSPAL